MEILNFKTVMAYSLEKGMRVINIGVVKQVDEYANGVLVIFQDKPFKLDHNEILFRKGDSLKVQIL